MLGAIIGDIIGSPYEMINYKKKDFTLFNPYNRPTHDSIMTIAVAKALLLCNGNYEDLGKTTIIAMQKIGRAYPKAGYGHGFLNWLFSPDPKPYNSFGNGAAMRVSPCGYVGNTIDEVKALSKTVTEVSHNHPEGIKGAEATAVAVFLARQKKSKEEIKTYIEENYYPLNFTIDEIRDTYTFDVTCQGSVPQAIKAFLESESYEDAIRIAISLGGDSDTIAAIAGGIAGAFYGIPEDIKEKAITYLDKRLLDIVNEFIKKFCE